MYVLWLPCSRKTPSCFSLDYSVCCRIRPKRVKTRAYPPPPLYYPPRFLVSWLPVLPLRSPSGGEDSDDEGRIRATRERLRERRKHRNRTRHHPHPHPHDQGPEALLLPSRPRAKSAAASMMPLHPPPVPEGSLGKRANGGVGLERKRGKSAAGVVERKRGYGPAGGGAERRREEGGGGGGERRRRRVCACHAHALSEEVAFFVRRRAVASARGRVSRGSTRVLEVLQRDRGLLGGREGGVDRFGGEGGGGRRQRAGRRHWKGRSSVEGGTGTRVDANLLSTSILVAVQQFF